MQQPGQDSNLASSGNKPDYLTYRPKAKLWSRILDRKGSQKHKSGILFDEYIRLVNSYSRKIQ